MSVSIQSLLLIGKPFIKLCLRSGDILIDARIFQLLQVFLVLGFIPAAKCQLVLILFCDGEQRGNDVLQLVCIQNESEIFGDFNRVIFFLGTDTVVSAFTLPGSGNEEVAERERELMPLRVVRVTADVSGFAVNKLPVLAFDTPVKDIVRSPFV